MALLEADVHVGVVRACCRGYARRRSRSRPQEPDPGSRCQDRRDELEALLGGGEANRFKFASRPPTVVFMVGLQGSGRRPRRPSSVSGSRPREVPLAGPVDVYRPAAIEQLIRVGKSAGLKVYEHDGSRSPVDIARDGLLEARRTGYDTVLVDTAGRLHIDTELMDELRALKAALLPQEILFVADAMTGQDAVRSAGEFHKASS